VKKGRVKHDRRTQVLRFIKKLVETNGNKKAAALKLNCTQRHVNRLIKEHNLEEWKGLLSTRLIQGAGSRSIP